MVPDRPMKLVVCLSKWDFARGSHVLLSPGLGYSRFVVLEQYLSAHHCGLSTGAVFEALHLLQIVSKVCVGSYWPTA